jgi:predicted ATPase
LSGDDVTILAGKNESGKTAILEALEDFNTDKQIREDAKPLHHADAIPEIAINFEVYEPELKDIGQTTGIAIQAADAITVRITKRYPKTWTYEMSEASRDSIGLKTPVLQEGQIKKEYDHAKRLFSESKIAAVSMPGMDPKQHEMWLPQLTDFKRNVQPYVVQIADDSLKAELPKALDKVIDYLNEFEKERSNDKKFFDELAKWIPNFILFSSFDDVFPSEILIAEADKNQLIKDLDIISDLNLQLIKTGNSMQKAKHKKQLNMRIGERYQKFWKQDQTNLSVDWDSTKLDFLVTEGDEYFPPKMRSKGKQWHMAFYIRVSARAKENVSNVILIDEPGLYLHARAQKDILDQLEDCANEQQVVFSTHSPYLIDVNNLGRIRLISRTANEGTVVSNKIHKGADQDTLTPVITAIGLDLSRGLDIAKDNNVIFEGITDYYYTKAFQELISFAFDKDVHFIPGSGADKVIILASLMIGWGLNHCIVLDNDSKGRQTEDRVVEALGPDNVKIVRVSDIKDQEIEDLFTKEDFIKCVLKEEDVLETAGDKRNSQIIKQKDKKFDKVLLSKQFYEALRSGNVEVTTETRQNFERLLQKINKMLFS